MEILFLQEVVRVAYWLCCQQQLTSILASSQWNKFYVMSLTPPTQSTSDSLWKGGKCMKLSWMYEIYGEAKEQESEHYRRQMHWIAFPGRVTYSNRNFLTFQQMLQLPFSGWVNLGITVVPLCSVGSRQCAGWGMSGIFPQNAQCQKMASAAVPQTPKNLYWTMWPNTKRQSSAMNNGCRNLNIWNTENNCWRCKEG